MPMDRLVIELQNYAHGPRTSHSGGSRGFPERLVRGPLVRPSAGPSGRRAARTQGSVGLVEFTQAGKEARFSAELQFPQC